VLEQKKNVEVDERETWGDRQRDRETERQRVRESESQRVRESESDRQTFSEWRNLFPIAFKLLSKQRNEEAVPKTKKQECQYETFRLAIVSLRKGGETYF